MGCDGTPAGHAGDDHFVPAAVAAVWIAGAVADDNGHIGLRNQAVALNPVSHLILAQVEKIRCFAVIIQETIRIKLIDNVLTEIPIPIFQGIFAVQAHCT